MAEQLFKRYSGGRHAAPAPPFPPDPPWRAERERPLLMAISGHKRLATLQRYVKPI